MSNEKKAPAPDKAQQTKPSGQQTVKDLQPKQTEKEGVKGGGVKRLT